MAVEFKPVHLNNRQLERALLKESSGCSYEDEKNVTYGVNIDVILVLKELAKLLLGLRYTDLGTDPRNQQLGQRRDYATERDAIKSTDPLRKQKLKDLKASEDHANRVDDSYDADAWKALLELERRLRYRALSLQKIGLVEVDVTGILPEGANDKYRDEGPIALPNTVRITQKGLAFLASGKTLKRAKKQTKGAGQLDEDVEIVS